MDLNTALLIDIGYSIDLCPRKKRDRKEEKKTY